MADQFPDATKMATLSDRIARALCTAMAPDRDVDGARPCSTPCATCRDGAAAAAHEIAAYFSELYGGSRPRRHPLRGREPPAKASGGVATDRPREGGDGPGRWA